MRGAGNQAAAPPAELCRASGWRPAAPSSQPPAPQQPHWGGQGEACRASPVGSCTPSAGTSASGLLPKQRVNTLHPLALSAQWVQVLMEQEDMGTSLAGRPVPAVSVWLRN